MIETYFGQTKLQIRRGNLSQADVGALVRETDPFLGEEFSAGDLVEGGGRAFCSAVEKARKELGDQGLATGEVVVTDAGELDAQVVVHTTLPIWKNRYHGEKIDLEKSYQNGLVAAIDRELSTVAFPALGLGARQFPGYEATVIALNTIERVVTLKDRRTDYRGAIERVEIVLATDEDFQLYRRVYGAYAHRWDDQRAAG